jgi:hypothetical protein
VDWTHEKRSRRNAGRRAGKSPEKDPCLLAVAIGTLLSSYPLLHACKETFCRNFAASGATFCYFAVSLNVSHRLNGMKSCWAAQKIAFQRF